jgi:hypothetical protein
MTDDTAAPLTPEAPPAPSRFTRLLRRVMIWAAGLLLVFALGALANWWFQVRPKAAQVGDLTNQLNAASQELETLRPVATQAEGLSASLESAERRLLASQALAEINDARVAMAEGDSAGASMPILLADSRLASLAARLDAAQVEAVTAIRDRMRQARQELDGNAFAAQRDLEVVANDLDDLLKELAAAK